MHKGKGSCKGRSKTKVKSYSMSKKKKVPTKVKSYSMSKRKSPIKGHKCACPHPTKCAKAKKCLKHGKKK